jgi:hypothetical protein
MVLEGGIPSSSATKKKSRSPSTAWGNVDYNERRKGKKSAAAAAAANNNSPRAAAEAEPSELDKRMASFREKGLAFSYLYELTDDDQDLESAQNYGKYIVLASGNDESDEELITILMRMEDGDLSNAPVLRTMFQGRLQQYLVKLRGIFKDRKTALKVIVTEIQRNLGAIAVNIDLADLDDRLPLDKYMSVDERHRLCVIYARAEYCAIPKKPAVLASLLEFLEPIRRRLALRKNQGKTRKSQYGLKSKSASANANAAEKVYLKKQMTILGNQALTWAQKQNALRVLTNERKAYFRPVPFTGPISDSKGYKQHDGECSTDVITQVLQQGAPWAAAVQERLYNGTAADFSAMYDRTLMCSGVHPDREDMMALLLNMQERFKLHYTSAKKIEEAVTCIQPFDYSKIGPILTRKVRKSAELGPAIKKNVSKLTKSPLYSTIVSYIKHIFQLLFQFFGLSDILCYVRDVRYQYKIQPTSYLADDIQYRDYKHLAFAFRINHYPPNHITLQNRPKPGVAGHYTAIYKSLQGSWVYYDNEVGVLPLHRTLMGDILNERTHSWFIAYVYIEEGPTTTLTFYKIPYFNSSYMVELKNRVIEQWRGDSWHEVDFREIADIPRISAIDEHYHIVSKTSEEPGFDGLYMDDV